MSRPKLKFKYPEAQHVECSHDEAILIYKDMGYVELGSGNHAVVLRKGDHVLKIGFVNSDNYIHYVRLVGLRSKNPHFPYITSVELFNNDPSNPLSSPYYVIQMEALDPIPYQDDEDNAKRLSDEWKRYWTENLGHDNAFILDDHTIEYAKPKTKALVEVRDVLQHLYNCYDAGGDIAPSIYSHNVLYRNFSIPVFTDPVA